MGIPLVEGKVKPADAGRLYLADVDGKRIRCQVTPVAKWLGDGSVKWVHVTWNQSVKAKQKATVALVLGAAAAGEKPGVVAKEADNGVVVSNRSVRFAVRGPRFTGFHQAWFDADGNGQFNDGNLVIGGKDGGSKVTVGGKEFLSANDAEGKVEIEEQGPRRVVVKATGRHMDGDGKALDYIVRFYAYADSPVVRVSHTFVCAQGKSPADNLLIEKLFLDVPTTLSGGKVSFGTQSGPITGPAAGSIVQDTSDHYAVKIGDKTVHEGKGKSKKPLTTGWLDVTKGDLGVAVGVRWFWQMFPKSLELDGGTIRVGLFPGAELPLEAFMGISRTHYLTFVFHDRSRAPNDLNDAFAASQRPLRAWAPGKYYCRDTHCFGYAVENDPELFGDDWDKVQSWNNVQLRSVQMLLRKLDGNSYNGFKRDSYGIYAWGDRYHWSWPKWGQSPRHTIDWRHSWAGNYYDYPNAMIMAFLRTGDKTFLERFFPNAIQVGDVHTVNWHPQKKYIGACRYCPPRNFVALDGGRPYISNEFNHWKSQSVYCHWYLTGDRRSLDHCRVLANAALNNHDPDSGWAARGIGAHIIGLWNAYERTGEKEYFDRMKGMAERAMKQFQRGKYPKGGKFMWGIANEGLCHYYWASGDPRVIETLKAGLEKYSGRSNYPNGALACAMMYRVTGEQKYADWAWKALSRQKPSSRVHGPGCQFRGTHFALFFLSSASEGWRVEKK
jgi:hypothetical protein